MYWTKAIWLFFLATFKFMFSPATGIAMGFNMFESILICVLGATTCSATFYYSSDYFMDRARKKRLMKRQKAIELGLEFKEKKKFTRVNKSLIRFKKKIGIYGICFYVPLFLSIPVGSIVVAKFYGQFKKTFPLIFLGIVMNATILASLAYIVKIVT